MVRSDVRFAHGQGDSVRGQHIGANVDEGRQKLLGAGITVVLVNEARELLGRRGSRHSEHAVASVRERRDRLVAQCGGKQVSRRVLIDDRTQEAADRRCAHRCVQ